MKRFCVYGQSILVMGMVLFAAGCGSVKYASVTHEYDLPAVIPTGQRPLTYALIRKGPEQSLVVDHPGFNPIGMRPVQSPSQAEFLFEVVTQPLSNSFVTKNRAPKKTLPNGEYQQGDDWTAFADMRVEYTAKIIDNRGQQVVAGESGAVGDQRKLPANVSVPSRQDAEALIRAQVDYNQTRQIEIDLSEAAFEEALAWMNSVMNDLTGDKRIRLLMNVPKNSETMPEIAQAFQLLVARRGNQDVQNALAIYRRVGTQNILANGKPAVHENYAAAYGSAVCYFLLGDYQSAVRYCDLAISIRSDSSARELRLRSQEILDRLR